MNDQHRTSSATPRAARAVPGRVSEEVKDGARRSADISPEGKFVGLLALIWWIGSPYVVFHHYGSGWTWLTLVGNTVLIFTWGWVERRLEPRLARRRRDKRAARQQADIQPRGSVLRTLRRWLSIAGLLVFLVPLGIAWYGALLLTPPFLLFMAAGLVFGMGGAASWIAAVIGLPVGIWWVHWWVTRATPDDVQRANVVGTVS